MEKKITLFIGGSVDKNMSLAYNSLATELGKKINERDYRIIFDGCNGLPYLVFKEITDTSRSTIWITKYYDNDYMYSTSSVVYTFDNQSDFTKAIPEASDAMIFMKGSMGTITEIFHTIDSKKNKEHDKPIVILNVNNEWDDLINLLSSYDLNNLYYVTDNIIDALNHIELELYKESSSFYHYIKYGYIDKKRAPIIENAQIKK